MQHSHSSMVSSVPTILRPWVQIPSTPSTFFNLYWNCNGYWNEKRTKNQNRGQGWPLFLKTNSTSCCFLSYHYVIVLMKERMFVQAILLTGWVWRFHCGAWQLTAWRAINKFVGQLGRYKPSSPSTKELHGLILPLVQWNLN